MRERVVILGAGESGTGAAILAKAKGYDVFVSDQGTIKDQYKTELSTEGISYEEGKHSEEKIVNASLVIKSPGIPEKAEIIKKVRAKNIPVIDEIEFGFRFINGKVIAITGTNGKTTTTLLTYHLMKSAGKSVALAGNVGESLARKVAKGNHEWYVIEISSFQLDGTTTFQPHISILLNITPDHLDRYEYQMQKYVDSKFQLIQQMKAHNFFIFYGDDAVVADGVKKRSISPKTIEVSLNKESQSQIYFDGEKMSFSFGKESFKIAQSETTLKGPHNLINTMSAVSAVYYAGVSLDSIKTGLKTFKNAPHRLESVATINDVEFVNDSKATNVDSVFYALGSFKRTEPHIIWIVGGVDKGNEYEVLDNLVKEKVRNFVFLGKDNQKLEKYYQNNQPENHQQENERDDDPKKELKKFDKPIFQTQSIKEAIEYGFKVAKKGDIVLLSPACASFDLFQNYMDRGEKFRENVLNLIKN